MSGISDGESSRETALHEGEAWHRRLVDNVPVGVYRVEKSGRFIMVNQKMAEMFGFENPADFILSVENVNRLYARPEERPMILQEIEDRGVVKGKEVKFVRSDGVHLWVKLDTTLYKEGGKTIYEGLMEDITERKQAEEALRERERKFRELVENINEVVYRTDDKGNVVYVSPNIESISGYTQAEVVAKGFVDFVHPDDLAGRMENFLKIMSGKSIVSEYRFICKNKQIIWVRTNAVPILKDGRPAGVQGVLADITARKDMEETLRENAERLEVLIHTLPVGIVIIDPGTHRIVEVNPKAVLMIDAPADRIVGSSCHNFICPAEVGKCPITDQGKTIYNEEGGLITADGEIIAIQKTVLPINIDDRDLLLECFVDISEHKRAERERLTTEKLKGVMEMAGAVCHELNQPLQSVLGNAELLMMAVDKGFSHFEKVETITDQVKRMGDITKKLMRITRYETMDYLDDKIIDIEKSAD